MGGIAKPKLCDADVLLRDGVTLPPGDDPDVKIRHLRARLARISRAAERRSFWHHLPRKLLPFAVAFCVLAWGAVAFVTLSPWSASLTARHLVAALDCDTTRAVGLAPALRGQPGYWPWHDGDKDGIACEPRHKWTSRRNLSP